MTSRRSPAAESLNGARCLVTGAAGFIGSHLAEALLRRGARVTGVDALTDYYDPSLKRDNLRCLMTHPGFDLIEADLAREPLRAIVDGADYVYHLAAQPGVRASFGEAFPTYVERNVVATQALLEACRGAPVRRLVFASSSSVYGDAGDRPVAEDAPLRPASPYALTKAAGELLIESYARCHGVPGVVVRPFTVYGPRQRPDMAVRRFIRAVLAGEPVPVFGDGRQVRDFTYVGDVVDAIIAASLHGAVGARYNVSGGSPASVLEVIERLGRYLELTPDVVHLDRAPGDVSLTWGDTTAARRDLGYEPRTGLDAGLRAQVEYELERRAASAGDREPIQTG